MFSSVKNGRAGLLICTAEDFRFMKKIFGVNGGYFSLPSIYYVENDTFIEKHDFDGEIFHATDLLEL